MPHAPLRSARRPRVRTTASSECIDEQGRVALPKIELPRIHLGEERDQVRRRFALDRGRSFTAEELFIGEIVNGVLVHDPVVASQFLQREVGPGRDFHRRESLRDSRGTTTDMSGSSAN